MIRTQRRFKRFRLDIEDEVKEYEGILNNSLCTVTNREVQSEEVKTFNDQGRLSEVTKFTTYLVHWEEQIL